MLKGRARFIDPHTVAVETDKGEDRYVARNIIVATGTEVFIPPIPGSQYCLTSSDLYKLYSPVTTLPRSMVVIGGGYIGLETASFFTAFGCKVTLLQRSERVLTRMDTGMVETLVPLLDPGITILPRVQVQAIEKLEKGFRVKYRQDGADKSTDAEQVLMAAGRRPVLPAGLTSLGVELNARGYLVASEAMQTKILHIYSCGDINGRVLPRCVNHWWPHIIFWPGMFRLTILTVLPYQRLFSLCPARLMLA